MKNYSKFLLHSIENEINGREYIYPEKDKGLLKDLFKEINEYAGTDFHYLAELDAFSITGAGEIIAKYIMKFSSESVKGFLAPQMVTDRIENCDKMILQLYQHFRTSDEYISPPGKPSPAHIHVRYDIAFRVLRPKRLKNELIEFAYFPRDVYYLPFTTRMLASWQMPEMKDLLINYLKDDYVTAQDFGIYDVEKPYRPSFEVMRRQIMFTAIGGLKYYPSTETFGIVSSFVNSTDKDIRAMATKTLAAMTKNGVVDFFKRNENDE